MIWKYLQIHSKDLTDSPTLIMGDFNSNVIWDKEDRWWNHSDVVEELDDLNFKSLYHFQNSEEQGEEKIPTFYHQKKIEKPYHIDFCFASSEFINSKLEIGKVEKWMEFSDHMPLTIDL